MIPLDANLVKGSHGCIPPNDCDHPIFIAEKAEIPAGTSLAPTQIAQLILQQVFEEEAEIFKEKEYASSLA